jgi:hypothetical protein
MNFNVYGGFKIPTNKNTGHAIVTSSFWKTVDDVEDGLSRASGCYVFSIKFGQKITPWYVGKTEKLWFATACFKPANKVIFNDILVQHRGTPLIFLIPRLTPATQAFAIRGKYSSIDYLETMLIGCALKRNNELANIRKTKKFKDMHVPGIINSHHKLNKSASDLKNALGV